MKKYTLFSTAVIMLSSLMLYHSIKKNESIIKANYDLKKVEPLSY